MDDAIREFFDRYTEAFQKVDVDAIPEFYTIPSISIRGDGSLVVFDTREALRRFFEGVARGYHDEGMRRAAYEPIVVEALGQAAKVVTLRWVLYDEADTEIRNWGQTYNVADRDGEWKIYVSTFHLSV